MKKQLLILITTAAIFSSCSDRKSESSQTSWFDQCLSGAPPYPIAGISNNKLRSYEIINSSAEILTVRCTFKGDNGEDEVKTKILAVDKDGKLTTKESSDIEVAISANLLRLALESTLEGDGKTAQDLIRSGKVKLESLPSYIGEDYTKATFVFERKSDRLEPIQVTLLAPNGVTYKANANE